MSRSTQVLALGAALLLAACGGSSSRAPDAPDAAELDASTPPPAVFGGDRPTTLIVPSSYDPATPTPLLVALHPYFQNGVSVITQILGLEALAEAEGFLAVAPSGLTNREGVSYWNATDACCDFDGTDVDDEGYLLGLLDEIAAAYNVDPDRVYLLGYSNGAFMSYRLACAAASRFAALVSLAGATFATAEACAPDAPVSVLQVHGTADGTIAYEGGDVGLAPYPAATATVALWAGYNGCDGELGAAVDADLLGNPAGVDTGMQAYQGCPDGVSVELWTIPGGSHYFPLSLNDASTLWDWLAARRRVAR